MKTILSTLFICIAVVLFAFFGFEYLGDRESLKRGQEICSPYGVYEVETAGFGYMITCNDPTMSEPGSIYVDTIGDPDAPEEEGVPEE